MKRELTVMMMLKCFVLIPLFISPYAFSATIPITPNASITEDVVNGTENVYSINVKKDEGVTLALTPSMNSGGVTLYMYENEQLKAYTYFKTVSATTTLSTLDFKAASNATYYLQVKSSGNGSYKLDVYNAWFNAGVADADRTFHGSAYTAWDLKNGTYESSAKSTNWYRLTANAGSKIQIDVTPFLNSGGFNASIYEEIPNIYGTRATLASVSSSCCSSTNNVTKTLTYTPAVSGNYYLAINQDSGGTITLNTTGTNVGTYQPPTNPAPANPAPSTATCPTAPTQSFTTYLAGILKIPEVQVSNGLTGEVLKYTVELEWVPLAEPMMFKIKSTTPKP